MNRTHRTTRRLGLAAALCLAACSGGSGGGAAPADLGSVTFSLEHIIQRRLHADMWFPSVHAALQNPVLPLSAIPEPEDPCVSSISAVGDAKTGFLWRLRLTDCEDLNGVTRVIQGEITFLGDALADDTYSGTYSGNLSVVWKPDPDGGRSEDATRLNTEASTLAVTGSWNLDTGLEGAVTGVLTYSTGSATHTDELE